MNPKFNLTQINLVCFTIYCQKNHTLLKGKIVMEENEAKRESQYFHVVTWMDQKK